jgi:hypothetical protein
MIAVREDQEQRAEPMETPRYGALLRAAVAGDGPAAAEAAGALLADGAAPRRVYGTVVRTLLPRAILPARGGWPHGLFALDAALFLVEALPASERIAVLARAVGRAVTDWPAHDPIPRALPGDGVILAPGAWSAPDLAERVRAAALAGDGAGAEWALATLLAGPDRGSEPTGSVRKAAYGAVLSAAAQAEARTGGWGHLLVAGQHAVEIAELLSPSHTLLALRPALWAVARTISGGRHDRGAPRDRDMGWRQLGCALRLNQRPARPGETLQWAIALRTRPTPRVIEEALASGLERAALLDAAVLAVAGAMAAVATRRAPVSRGPASSHRFVALDTHALLALHAARRANDLVDEPDEAILAALGCLAHLSQRMSPRPSPRSEAAPTLTPADVARAAEELATPHALMLAEAILAEYEDAKARSGEYAAALMQAASVWLARRAAA